jgi:hypothetical protein
VTIRLEQGLLLVQTFGLFYIPERVNPTRERGLRLLTCGGHANETPREWIAVVVSFCAENAFGLKAARTKLLSNEARDELDVIGYPMRRAFGCTVPEQVSRKA